MHTHPLTNSHTHDASVKSCLCLPCNLCIQTHLHTLLHTHPLTQTPTFGLLSHPHPLSSHPHTFSCTDSSTNTHAHTHRRQCVAHPAIHGHAHTDTRTDGHTHRHGSTHTLSHPPTHCHPHLPTRTHICTRKHPDTDTHPTHACIYTLYTLMHTHLHAHARTHTHNTISPSFHPLPHSPSFPLPPFPLSGWSKILAKSMTQILPKSVTDTHTHTHLPHFPHIYPIPL